MTPEQQDLYVLCKTEFEALQKRIVQVANVGPFFEQQRFLLSMMERLAHGIAPVDAKTAWDRIADS